MTGVGETGVCERGGGEGSGGEGAALAQVRVGAERRKPRCSANAAEPERRGKEALAGVGVKSARPAPGGGAPQNEIKVFTSQLRSSLHSSQVLSTISTCSAAKPSLWS